MSLIFTTIQNSDLASSIKEDWFPYIEAIHVVAIVTVVGTIFMVDFRLLDLAFRRTRVSDMLQSLLHWTWSLFAVAVTTGLLMFISNINHYLHTWTFVFKLCLIALAGLNMLVFHYGPGRLAMQWDGAPAKRAGFSAATSILLWSGVIAAGRWTGFL